MYVKEDLIIPGIYNLSFIFHWLNQQNLPKLKSIHKIYLKGVKT